MEVARKTFKEQQDDMDIVQRSRIAALTIDNPARLKKKIVFALSIGIVLVTLPIAVAFAAYFLASLLWPI